MKRKQPKLNKSIFEFEEKPIAEVYSDCQDFFGSLEQLDRFREDNPEVLGITVKNGNLVASYWVGLVWLDEDKEVALRVKCRWEKEYTGKPVELILLEECLRLPQVAERLWGRKGIEAEKDGQLFHYWPEQTPIKVDKEEAFPGHLFLIAQFLYELKKLCERHLRRQFPRTENNLRGRVRGKVLIRENLRTNVCKGRLDRVFCSFQVHSLDTRENQILRAALEVSQAYLATRGFRLPVLWSLVQFCKSALADVTLRRILPEDFKGLRLTGLMKAYKKPLELARIILTHIASEPNPSKWSIKETEVFPYAINMPLLFERYCEVLMRTSGINGEKPEKLWPGSENLGKTPPVRPDFLIVKEGKGIVADAKYKTDWSLGNLSSYREDVYQVVAYTQHKKVREKLESLGAKQNQIGNCIWIFCPDFSGTRGKRNFGISEPWDFEPELKIFPVLPSPLGKVPFSGGG